jgi:hypothetical protein
MFKVLQFGLNKNIAGQNFYRASHVKRTIGDKENH